MEHEIRFEAERFADVAAVQARLTDAHWQETELELYGPVPHALDVSGFEALEQAGLLHIQTVRVNGSLEGYAGFILARQPQLGGMVTANLLGLYLDPGVRKLDPWIALKLLRSAENALLARGVSGVVFGSPHSRPCDALYRRLGAEPIETMYYKKLEA